MKRRHLAVTAGALATAAVAAAPAVAEKPGITGPMGPSTTTSPYVLPVAPGARTASLLTVGDSVGGYEMVGIPDGLGAYRDDGGHLTLLMNHELQSGVGTVRRHGQTGAFVSEWSIDRRSFAVEAGRDLINPGVQFWDYAAGAYSLAASGPFGQAFARFCSNTLSDPGVLLNEDSGNGYDGRLFFPNEENGDNGRSFGLTTDGVMAQLPRLGLFSYENTIPAHNRTDTTLVMGQEDGGDGQIWAYAGTKQASGTPFDRAGLTNGGSHVAAVAGAANDAGFRAAFGKDNPQRFTLSEVGWNQTGAAQNAEAKAEGLSLNRIEDGHWDPANPDDFYFLTTEGGDKTPAEPGVSRDGGGLWRLRFDDIEDPRQGGTLTLLLDGSEAPFLNKPDNMAIDTEGNLLIQEDPGGNAHVARIVAYRIADGARGVLARFDPARFSGAGAITQDEESSGIIDAIGTVGPRWFLFDAQVHKASGDPETVELGQLLALHVDRWKDVYDIGG
jgi:hypothetical protein